MRGVPWFGGRAPVLSWRRIGFATVALAVLALGGCRKAEEAGSGGGKASIDVLCGSSFVAPMEQLCSEFTKETGIETAMSTAGSEDFLPQVKAASVGDILVTHDPFLDLVREAGKLADHVEVGYVAPVLAVQKGNPKGLKSLEDLAKPGIKVALSNPEYSTCGEMVFKLLEKKGIKDGVLANVGNRLTKGHSQLGNLLKTKTVDAVVMWNGVAHTFGEAVDIVPVPYEYDTEIQLHVMSLNYSKHPEETKRFIAFLRKRGAETFAEHGYVK